MLKVNFKWTSVRDSHLWIPFQANGETTLHCVRKPWEKEGGSQLLSIPDFRQEEHWEKLTWKNHLEFP